ncbi:hypothetical protein HMPREF3038_02742 [Akkermansia sp. KLE1797]|nr:hypothetical protein HMPREF3038_02742 [Akkermansia sp. KLE1797]
MTKNSFHSKMDAVHACRTLFPEAVPQVSLPAIPGYRQSR